MSKRSHTNASPHIPAVVMHQIKNLSIIVLGVLDVSFVDLLCLPLAIFHFDFSAGQRVLRILTAVTLLPLITVKQTNDYALPPQTDSLKDYIISWKTELFLFF